MTGVYEEGISPRSALGTRQLPGARSRSRDGAGRVHGRLDAPTAISLTYAGCLLIWHALRFTPIGGWPLFEVVDIFGLALFAPLPLLLLLSMLCASRRAGLVLMVPVLLLAATYGPLFLPRTVPSIFRGGGAASGPTLRVMTANLLVSNEQRPAVAGLIQMERPDIVALQELSPAMAEHLARELRDQYPYQLVIPSEAPNGLGVLSRYPLHVKPGTGWYTHVCSCQRVTVDRDGQTLTLVNVHPPPPSVSHRHLGPVPVPTGFDRRLTQEALHAALDDLDGWPRPLIVLGDFNVGDRQPLYRELRRTLLDAHAEAGWGLGYSFPNLAFEGLPAISLVRIDYILHDRTLTARMARTGATPGSDHRHVVADLALR